MYMYAYIDIPIYIYIYTCMCIYTQNYTYIARHGVSLENLCACTYMSCIYIRVHVYTYPYSYTYIYMHVCTYIYTNAIDTSRGTPREPSGMYIHVIFQYTCTCIRVNYKYTCTCIHKPPYNSFFFFLLYKSSYSNSPTKFLKEIWTAAGRACRSAFMHVQKFNSQKVK